MIIIRVFETSYFVEWNRSFFFFFSIQTDYNNGFRYRTIFDLKLHIANRSWEHFTPIQKWWAVTSGSGWLGRKVTFHNNKIQMDLIPDPESKAGDLKSKSSLLIWLFEVMVEMWFCKYDRLQIESGQINRFFEISHLK